VSRAGKTAISDEVAAAVPVLFGTGGLDGVARSAGTAVLAGASVESNERMRIHAALANATPSRMKNSVRKEIFFS
jgi:hypothetical protein